MTDSSSDQSQSGPIRLRVFGRTDVGRVREHNEDNFIIADLTRRTRSLREEDRKQTVGERGTMMAVCDGMGGAAAGEVASEIAVDLLMEKLSEGDAPTDHDDLARRLVRAVEAAGLRIYSEAKLDRHRRGMGTTATVAALIDSFLFLAQVGDSRAYILRGDRMVQVTRDQSLVNQLIEAGQLTEEEAENFEHNNIILQALGTSDTVQVDLTYVELRRSDTLLLCSDGLSGMIRADEIMVVLLQNDEPLEACRILTDRANEAGGHDNVTCIVARFEGEGLPDPSPDDDLPQYSKYTLPEDRGPDTVVTTRRGAVKELAEGKPGADEKHRLEDHGPSRSKVAQTMVGMSVPAIPGVDRPVDGVQRPWGDGTAMDDEIVLPVENTPLWVLAAIVIAVFGGIVALAYFVIIKPS
jgi:protein phosphatase